MRFKLLMGAAGAALLSVASAAGAAEKRDFHLCDGLSTPGKGGASGMAPAAATGAFGPTDAAGGKAIVAACTAALADPRLQPNQSLRRSHLLRARAIAQQQAGDPDAALGDLDAAVAAAGPLAADPLFARSMGASFELIRAAALLAKGDRAEARRLAAAAALRRPYSASFQTFAATLAQRARDPDSPAAPSLAPLMAIVPDAVKLQFLNDVEAGRFATAAALYPRITPAAPPPSPFPNFNLLVESLYFANGAGYAFAATGQVERARTVMAEAKAKLEAALVPPADPKKVPYGLDTMATPLRTYLERGTVLVDARIAVAERRPRDALKLLVGNPIPVSAASVELLTALRAALPADSRALAPDPTGMIAKLAEQRKAESFDVAALRKGLGSPETTANLADYQKSTSGFLYNFFVGPGSSDGFKAKTDSATGITKVEFVGAASSQPTVEELTLLHAADLARQAGKPGLLIVARRDFTRTLQMTRNGIPISSSPAGYMTELDVRFVDPAALPAQLIAERDRVLDANVVWAALSPIYIPAGSAPPARK